jgi:hypothetical protein
MSFDSDPKSPFDPEPRPGEAAATDAGDGRLLLAVPSVEVLLRAPAFAGQSPIALSALPPRLADGWAEFGPVRARGFTIH